MNDGWTCEINLIVQTQCTRYLLCKFSFGTLESMEVDCDATLDEFVLDFRLPMGGISCMYRKKSQRKTRQLLITHCTLTTGCSNASRWILS